MFSSGGPPNTLAFPQMEGPLWSEARDALAGAAELSRQKGGEGLDIYCLNGLQHRLDFRVSRYSSFITKAQTDPRQG
jgi:hypothetical protein